ncbi:MAG: aryl-sulfate sulfotransferase [Planctomycetota bacterium]|jgi:hypothetical protein
MSYVRALSQDVQIHDQSKAYKGYTLFAPMFGTVAWLIDMEGRVVNYWEFENQTLNAAKLSKNGTVFWHARGPGAIEELASNSTEMIEADWDGNEVWRYEDKLLNHDYVLLENGNLLLMTYLLIPEDVQKKIKGGAPGTEINGRVYGIGIIEITREKEIVWEWKNYEHLDFDIDVRDDLDPKMCWGYANSINVFPNGDILISMRYFNTIARIEKKTGNIIWRWGRDELLGHQHCATVLENGNVMCFDNGLHRQYCKPEHPLEVGTTFETSRVVEVDPKTNKVVWEYIDPQHLMYTNICGSAQRLPNGNTLICESKKGVFYEVTPEKEIVWQYENPFTTSREAYWGWTESKLVFQVYRYGPDFPGFKGKDLDPDRFEWMIRRKSKEDIDLETQIKNRQARLGY